MDSAKREEIEQRALTRLRGSKYAVLLPETILRDLIDEVEAEVASVPMSQSEAFEAGVKEGATVWCPDCDGNGEYSGMVDCPTCDGQQRISREYAEALWAAECLEKAKTSLAFDSHPNASRSDIIGDAVFYLRAKAARREAERNAKTCEECEDGLVHDENIDNPDPPEPCGMCGGTGYGHDRTGEGRMACPKCNAERREGSNAGSG